MPDWVVGCQAPAEVAYVARRYHNGRMPEIEAANARLIAAAPELLDALETILLCLDLDAKAMAAAGVDVPKWWECTIARAAIAKARGLP